MWFGEPHPFPGERITYRTERVGATKVKKDDGVDYTVAFANFIFRVIILKI